jgi:DNA-directed RNA polymerase subunit RPC12/RpoP
MTDHTMPTGSMSRSYPCAECGARLEFAPGTNALRCPYCGHEQPVVAAPRQVREYAFADLAELPRKLVANLGGYAFCCQKCGAKTQSNALSDTCQFCGAPLVAAAGGEGQIVPEAVVPFAVDHNGVRTALRDWVSSRWFAPSALKKVNEAESLKGTYLPHWTFDARTVSQYHGQRGDYYYQTETYTENVNGQSQTKTRQVRRTRWSRVGGTVQRDFDDVLVVATGQMTEKQLDRLTPWPLGQARPYQPDYLAGHQTLRYDVEPQDGLVTAKKQMKPIIENDCRRDIGGDEQRVDSVDTGYHDLTYKLILLPVWIACYLHAGKSWQVLVNGHTGEVIGQRPYSTAKIISAVLAVIAVLTTIIVLYATMK